MPITWPEHWKCFFVGLKKKCSCTFVPFLSHYVYNNLQCHTHIRKALFKSFPLMCILVLFISYTFDKITSDRDHFELQKSKLHSIKKATFLFKAISPEPFMPPASAAPQKKAPCNSNLMVERNPGLFKFLPMKRGKMYGASAPKMMHDVTFYIKKFLINPRASLVQACESSENHKL